MNESIRTRRFDVAIFYTIDSINLFHIATIFLKERRIEKFFPSFLNIRNTKIDRRNLIEAHLLRAKICIRRSKTESCISVIPSFHKDIKSNHIKLSHSM